MRTLTIASAVAIGALALVAAAPPNVDRALRQQEERVTANPTDARAHNDLGNLRLLAGDRDGALAAYERAVEIDPTLVSAHFNLGLLSQERGAYESAATEYRKVIELLPEHAWAHFQLGTLAERRGSDRQAVRHYATAFRIDPRLTFHDVNPQVIDSELVTVALLRLDEERVSGREAPRSYEEGERIATMLLPAPPAPEDEAPGATEESVSEETGATGDPLPARTMRPAAERESDEATTRPEGTTDRSADDDAAAGTTSKRITADDLTTGSSVGEATPIQGSTTGTSRGNATSRQLQERLRQRYRQRRSTGTRVGTASTGRVGTQVNPDGR